MNSEVTDCEIQFAKMMSLVGNWWVTSNYLLE